MRKLHWLARLAIAATGTSALVLTAGAALAAGIGADAGQHASTIPAYTTDETCPPKDDHRDDKCPKPEPTKTSTETKTKTKTQTITETKTRTKAPDEDMDKLPVTGTGAMTMAAIGAGLVTAGAVMVARRRRRSAED